MAAELEASPGIVLPVERQRKVEEVRRLFDNEPIGLAATVINASILAGILRDWIDPSILAVWWGAVMALSALRFAHGEWFRRAASKQEVDAGKWGGALTAGIFASGLVWGAAGIWLLPESVAHQTFVAFVLGGMVAGAPATYSIRMDAFLAYALPTLAPLAVRFFALGDELHVAMAGMVVLFGVLLTATALQVHRLTSRTLDLSSEVAHLEGTLRVARANVVLLETRLERAQEVRSETTAPGESNEVGLGGHFMDAIAALDPARDRSRLESSSARAAAGATSTDIAEFLRGFARSWEDFRPANVDVWWNWSGGPLAIRTDPHTLELVFRQILANACEAIGEKRGTIEVRARRSTRKEGGGTASYVTVEVIDDGAGMSKNTLDHLFEPFFSTKSRERGLGMAIVKSLVIRHRGKIFVESTPLRGTEVRLLLPESEPLDQEEAP